MRPVNPRYSLHHPRWHRRRIPIFWWLGKLAYVKFIARELTSLAVVYAAALLVAQLWALARGGATYQRFLELLASPWAVALNLLVLAGLLFHSFTWIHLAPRAMALELGRRRLPDWLVLAGHYAGWLAATALVVWGIAG